MILRELRLGEANTRPHLGVRPLRAPQMDAAFPHPPPPHSWCVVMSDDRPLVRQDRSGHVGSFGTLTATINHAYALRHSYGFLHVQITRNTCQHAVYGPRHTAWCKLPVIASVLIDGLHGRKCNGVLFLDSDAYVANHSLSIDEYFARARARGDEALADSAGEPWELLFASDFWFHPEELNTGAFFARGGPRFASRACGLLRRWWDAYFPAANLQKPWEQAAIQAMYLQLQGPSNKWIRHQGIMGSPVGAAWGSRVRLLPSARFFRRGESQWTRMGAAWMIGNESDDIYTEDDFIQYRGRGLSNFNLARI